MGTLWARGGGSAGLAFWDRVTGAAHWLWPQVDESLLIMAAEGFDERAELKTHLKDNPEDWRNRAALRSLEKQIFHYLSALGFTPGDRAKLGLIEAKVGGKFEELMRKREEMGLEF